jgi:hypothetical protein
MRGAERPAKVQWTRPFLQPLKPLTKDAAYQTFIDIADDCHKNEDIEQLLLMTDNMPLAVTLVAYLVDYEGCPSVLARWQTEKTAMLSTGYDRKSSLSASIKLSLSSPRMSAGAKDLLSLLAILPDGISAADLLQLDFPIKDILGCKAVLLRTSLAYNDDNTRLKALVPIREYVQSSRLPPPQLVQPLSMYFKELLRFGHQYRGRLTAAISVDNIASNLANLQNVLSFELHHDNPHLVAAVESIIFLNRLRLLMGLSCTPLIDDIPGILLQLKDQRLHVLYIGELFQSWKERPVPNPDALVDEGRAHCSQLNDPSLEGKLLR